MRGNYLSRATGDRVSEIVSSSAGRSPLASIHPVIKSSFHVNEIETDPLFH